MVSFTGSLILVPTRANTWYAPIAAKSPFASPLAHLLSSLPFQPSS